MPPRANSRYRHCRGVLDDAGNTLLTQREPFGFRRFADTIEHRVVEGDSLWGLAARYYAALERPAGYWWVIADFQPEPIVDPTLTLEVGRVLVIPSLRVLTDVILGDRRRGTR
jgi:hypothetical protein